MLRVPRGTLRSAAVTSRPLEVDHPDTAIDMSNLALTYRDLGRHADALPLEERASQIRQYPR